MPMSDKGELTTVPCVRFTRILPGPIEKVWAHLTDTRLLPAWFGDDSSIEPRQGGAVRLMGGHVRGVVTQWQPPNKLAYSWNVFGPDDAPDAISAYPESYPTFALATRAGEVVLDVVHFPVLERFVPQNAMGWHTMLDMVTAVLHGRPVQPRSVYAARNAALYGVDLSNLER